MKSSKANIFVISIVLLGIVFQLAGPMFAYAQNGGGGGGGGGGGSQQQNNKATGEVTDIDQYLSCGISTLLTDCMIEFLYDLVYWLSAKILYLGAWVFDIFLKFSISSYMYNVSSFVTAGWSIVRDIANIFFIFILLYVAIGLIVGLHHGFSPGRMIAQVIVIALLINFSLLFCRIAIDLSNATANVFYNSITIQISNDNKRAALNFDNTGEVKELSSAVASGLNINRVFSKDVLDSVQQEPSSWASRGLTALQYAGAGACLTGFGCVLGGVLYGIGAIGHMFTSNGGLSRSMLFSLTVIGIILNLTAAWIFFSMGIYFLGRILGLWFSMIFAPLALVTMIIPGISKKFDDIGWDKWTENFTGLLLQAPIVMFFLYLVILLLNSPFLNSLLYYSKDLSTFEIIFTIIFPYLMIIGLLKATKKAAEKLSGEFGKQMASIAKTVGGLVLGGAAVAGAAVAVPMLGGAAARMGTSETLRGLASGEKKLFKEGGTFDKLGFNSISKQVGFTGLKAGKMGEKSSFDFRNAPGISQLSSAAGINLNSGLLKGMGLGADAKAGGFVKWKEDKVKEVNEKAALLGYDEHAAHEESDFGETLERGGPYDQAKADERIIAYERMRDSTTDTTEKDKWQSKIDSENVFKANSTKSLIDLQREYQAAQDLSPSDPQKAEKVAKARTALLDREDRITNSKESLEAIKSDRSNKYLDSVRKEGIDSARTGDLWKKNITRISSDGREYTKNLGAPIDAKAIREAFTAGTESAISKLARAGWQQGRATARGEGGGVVWEGLQGIKGATKGGFQGLKETFSSSNTTMNTATSTTGGNKAEDFIKKLGAGTAIAVGASLGAGLLGTLANAVGVGGIAGALGGTMGLALLGGIAGAIKKGIANGWSKHWKADIGNAHASHVKVNVKSSYKFTAPKEDHHEEHHEAHGEAHDDHGAGGHAH